MPEIRIYDNGDELGFQTFSWDDDPEELSEMILQYAPSQDENEYPDESVQEKQLEVKLGEINDSGR